jgi:hypothetical protein
MTAKKRSVIVGLSVAAMVVGIGIGSLIKTNNVRAADTAEITTAQVINSATNPTAPSNQTKTGHVGASGIHEELLTGDTAAKVTAAALKAYPGGTIQRVETDAEGAVYEAHMTKADGSQTSALYSSPRKYFRPSIIPA